MIFKLDLKKFLISIAIPLSVGGISALIVHGNTDIYSKINQPPLAPPSWVFPVVWTVLYLLMGISLYIVWNTRADSGKKQLAFLLFGIQLFLNLIWSPIFFGLQLFDLKNTSNIIIHGIGIQCLCFELQTAIIGSFANTVYYLADICGIFEFCYISAQLKKATVFTAAFAV